MAKYWQEHQEEGDDALAVGKPSNMRPSISAEEAMAFIFYRSKVCGQSCNSHHITCVLAQMKAVAWLFSEDGKEPGPFDNLYEVFEHLGIKHVRVDSMLFWGVQMEQEKEKYLKLKAEKGQEAAEKEWE